MPESLQPGHARVTAAHAPLLPLGSAALVTVAVFVLVVLVAGFLPDDHLYVPFSVVIIT